MQIHYYVIIRKVQVSIVEATGLSMLAINEHWHFDKLDACLFHLITKVSLNKIS